MNKRLAVQMDCIKLLKDSEGKDVPVVFSLLLPYGVQYSLAYEAIDELLADLKAMDEAGKKKEDKVADDAVIPEVEAEIV